MRARSDAPGWGLARIACISLLAAGGCSGYSGLSDFEKQKAAKQNFINEVAELRGLAEEKFFAVHGKSGMAWVIDISGATVSDGLIENMSTLGYIAEMNLSESTITDEQLLRMDELKVGRVVMNLNLSGTTISDASLTKLKNFYCVGKLNVKETNVTPGGVEQFRKNQQSNPQVPPPFRNPKVEL